MIVNSSNQLQNSFSNLGQCIEMTKGYAFKSSWFSNNGYPIVKVSNFTEDSIDISNLLFIPNEIAKDYQKYKILHGDVIIQTVGSWPRNPNSVVGKVIKVPSNLSGALLNQNAVLLKPNCKLEKKYLFYLLKEQSFKKYIIGTAQGAANQASITLESIKSFTFQRPIINIQQKIASILSAYDDLIENNLKRIKILKEMAQLIYREWFVNFRFPGHENVRMVDSPMGMIPEGWEVKKLGEVIELAYGKGLKQSTRKDGKIPVFGSSGIIGFHNESLVKGSGVIVGRKGNVGSVHWSYYDFYPIDTVYYVISELPLYYVYFNLQKQNFINNDAAVPGLSRTQAYLLPFLVPSENVLEYFTDIIEPKFELIKSLQSKNENLQNTRDLLLSKLISGEIDVSGMDIEVSELNQSSE